MFITDYKIKLDAQYQSTKYELSKRVSNEDFKLNFTALSDLLMLKFEQLEDCK